MFLKLKSMHGLMKNINFSIKVTSKYEVYITVRAR